MSIEGLGTMARKYICFSPAHLQSIRSAQSLEALRQLSSLDLWTAQNTVSGTISKVCDSALANMWCECLGHGSHSEHPASHPPRVLTPLLGSVNGKTEAQKG